MDPTALAFRRPSLRAWLTAAAMLTLLLALVPATPATGAPVDDPGEPRVELLAPDSAALAVAATGATFDLAFTANRSWPYLLEARPTGTDGSWTEVATGTASRGENAVAVEVPETLEPAVYDLRLRLFVPASGRAHERTDELERGRDHVDAALHVIPADLPTTGFEDADGEHYTSHEEELVFLAAVDAASPRMTYTEVGETVEERPIHLVRLGHPAPPADADIADGRSILIIGVQHGNEPAGREMALQVLRHLAVTDDPELVAQLSDTTVLFIPTANPDGRAADTRGNAHGVDPNRDHLHVNIPEGQTIAEVLRDFTPDITVDAHEGPSTPNNPGQTPRLELSWPRNLNVDEGLRDLSQQLVEDYVFPPIEDAGYPTGIYGSPGGAGGGDERIGRNMIGLRHGIGMLIETFNATPADRVELQVLTAHEVLRFHRERTEDIAAAVAAAPDRKAAAGADQEPFYVGGSDWEPPSDGDILDPAPCGYLLNHVQADTIGRHAELFPLALEQVSNEAVFVTMAQPLMTVVPLLLDERASFNVVEGRPLQDCSDPGSKEPPEPPPPPSPPAQHFTDFSDAEVGEVPEGWWMPWTESDWSVLDDPRVLRHVVDTAGGRRALVWDEPGTVVGEVELYTMVRADSANTMFQLPLHVSGEAGSENAYYVDARIDQSALRINRYLDGSFTTIGRADFEPEQDTWYHLRFRREGDTLMTKVWADGEDEPGWQATATDTSHDSGAVGFAGFQTNSVNDWAFLGVGVGGEPAPGPNG